jgi:hypothetical protein
VFLRHVAMTVATGVALASCTITGGPSAAPEGEGPTEAPLPICDQPRRDIPLDLGIQAAGTGRGQGELPVSEVRRLVAEAKDAGADIISTTASWSSQKPDASGRYDWEAMDRVIDLAGQAGLKVRLTLQTMPRWAQDRPRTRSVWRAPRSAAERARWRGFVADLASHVRGRVDLFEVWTDPNATVGWATGPDPAEFVRLLHDTHRTVERVAPGIKTISGGLSGNAIGFLEGMYVEQERLGGIELFDRVGLNLTADDRAPAEGPEISASEPFGLYDRTFMGYLLVRKVMDEHGDQDVPLYVTRFGYLLDEESGMTEEVRADYAVQALYVASCDPDVGALSWYNLHQTRFDDPGWSLLDRLDRPTPTLLAIRNWFSGTSTPPSSPPPAG